MLRSNRLVFASLLALIACNKAGSSGGPMPGGKVEGAAATALDVLPKETTFVFGFNWNKLKTNKYLKNALASMPAEAKANMDMLKQSCGIDPVNDLQSIVVAGGSDMTDASRIAFLIKGNWSKDKIASCLTKTPKKVTATDEGDLTAYTVEDKPHPIYFAWVAKDTAMTTMSAVQSGDKSYLGDLLKAKGGLKNNKLLSDLLAKTDTTYGVWAAMLLDANAAAMAGPQMGIKGKLEGVWFMLDVPADLTAFVGMRLDKDAKPSADALNQKLDEARKQAADAKDLLKDVSVKADGNDVHIKAHLTDAQVDQLAEMVKSALPFLMGGLR